MYIMSIVSTMVVSLLPVVPSQMDAHLYLYVYFVIYNMYLYTQQFGVDSMITTSAQYIHSVLPRSAICLVKMTGFFS